MEDLKKIIGGVQEAQARAKESARAVSAAEAQLAQVQQNIIAGTETTGDKLHDGLIALYGNRLVRSPEIIERYQRVADELKQCKQGEPVALIHRWTELGGCAGMGGKGDLSLEKAIMLGVVNDNELIFDYDQKACLIPTERFALSVNGYPRRDCDRINHQNLPIKGSDTEYSHYGFDLGYHLDTPLYNIWSDHELPALSGNIEELTNLTVAVGYEGIANWLVNQEHKSPFSSSVAEWRDLRHLCDVLGVAKIEPVTDAQKFILRHSDD